MTIAQNADIGGRGRTARDSPLAIAGALPECGGNGKSDSLGDGRRFRRTIGADLVCG